MSDKASRSESLKFDDRRQVARHLSGLAARKVCVVSGSARKLPEKFDNAVFVDLSGMSSVIEHNAPDMVASVEAGMTIGALQDILVTHDQWVPISAPSPDITLGELIAANHGGCLECGYGGLKDLVLGMSLALTGGRYLNCGGKVVKNVSGYDLQKLFIGSRETLGVICSLNLRLFSRPEKRTSLLLKMPGITTAYRAAHKLRTSGLSLACLEMISAKVIEAKAVALGVEYLLNEWQLAGILSDYPCAIVIEIHGAGAMVGESSLRVMDLLADEVAEAQELKPTQGERLWGLLADLPCGVSGDNQVEVVVPFGRHPQFLSQVNGEAEWQARPSTGRFKFISSGAMDKQRFYARCARFAEEVKELVSIAASDGNHEYAVQQYPAPDEKSVVIKSELKRRFDPGGFLNPQVRL